MYRVNTALDHRPHRGESLIAAIAEPPTSKSSRIYDAGGLLAEAAPGPRWAFTERGEARIRAEAEGWLPLFDPAFAEAS